MAGKEEAGIVPQHVLVLSRLDYCNSILRLGYLPSTSSVSSRGQLKMRQHGWSLGFVGIRSITDAFISLHCLRVSERILLKTAVRLQLSIISRQRAYVNVIVSYFTRVADVAYRPIDRRGSRRLPSTVSQ